MSSKAAAFPASVLNKTEMDRSQQLGDQQLLHAGRSHVRVATAGFKQISQPAASEEQVLTGLTPLSTRFMLSFSYFLKLFSIA